MSFNTWEEEESLIKYMTEAYLVGKENEIMISVEK